MTDAELITDLACALDWALHCIKGGPDETCPLYARAKMLVEQVNPEFEDRACFFYKSC